MIRPLLMLALLIAAPAHARQPTPRPILTVSVGPAAERPPMRPGHARIELEVSSDGRFELEGRHGQLPRDALRQLQRSLAKTRVALLPPARVNCMAIPVRRTSVKTSRGAVSWASPCGRSPHPSVWTLLDDARALLARHLPAETDQPDEAPAQPATITTLVSYQVTSHRSPMGGESLTLRSDGAWAHQDKHGARSGVLSAAELRAIGERLRTVRVGPSPNPHHCAAMLEGQGTVTVAGRGTHTFSVPCSELDPSLAALLSELRALTRR